LFTEKYATNNLFVNEGFIRYNGSMTKRILFDFVLFISIFLFPWYISFSLLLLGIFIFNDFYEFIAGGAIAYSLYAVSGERLISSPVSFSLILIVVYIFIQFVRSNIIFYKK
jgi:hypothetical protein